MRGRPVAARLLGVLALLGGAALAGAAAAAPAVTAPAVVPPRLDPAPVMAYPKGAEGDADVTLVLTIAKDGQVRSAEVETGAEPFASAAKEAAASWRFEPATREGRPVAAKIRFAVTFHGEKTTPAPAEPEPLDPPEAASKPAAGEKPGAAKAPPKKVDPIEILIRADKLPPAVTSLSRAEVR
ncbi:MAG: TonB family protein, partial [Byssovorax sp.]